MNDNAKKWVAALRSGEYQQGRNSLREGDCFCCLGVACDLFLKDGNEIRIEVELDKYMTYDGKSADLPVSVQRWLGLKTSLGKFGVTHHETLAFCNDNLGLTFEAIAKTIEANTESLFV